MKHATERQLNEYFDNELAEGERDAVAAHLTACAQCRAALGRLEEVAQALQGLPEEAPERDLANAFLARSPEKRMATGWKLALAAQGAAIAGMLALVLPRFLDWVQPREWLERAARLAVELVPALPQVRLEALRLPHLELPFTAEGLVLLGGAVLLLWGVGNAVLLGSRREVRK